jgi:hypothetical protein
MKKVFLVITVLLSQFILSSVFGADNFDYKNTDGYKNANVGEIAGADSSCFLALAYINAGYKYKAEGLTKSETNSKMLKEKLKNRKTKDNVWTAKFVSNFVFSHDKELDSKSMDNLCKYSYFNER